MTRRRCASSPVRKGPARTLCYVSTFFRRRELIISGRAHRLVDLALHRRQGFPIGQVATQRLMNFRSQNGLDQSELWRRRARKRFQQVPFGLLIDHADDRRRGRSGAKRHKARRSARIDSSAMRGKACADAVLPSIGVQFCSGAYVERPDRQGFSRVLNSAGRCGHMSGL